MLDSMRTAVDRKRLDAGILRGLENCQRVFVLLVPAGANFQRDWHISGSRDDRIEDARDQRLVF